MSQNGSIGQPVKALVESVLNGEWVVVSDTENNLLLNHDTHNLELTFAKISISTMTKKGHFNRSVIRLVDAEWMEPAEKRYAEEHLNDWWAKPRKALDTERRAEARNKFMILVKETDEQA